MRLLLYAAALLGLLAARPAGAQSTSPGALPPPAAGQLPRPDDTPVVASIRAAAPPAVPDTAAALHHLFARYRGRRLRVVLGTLLVGSGLTIASAVSVKRTNDPLAAGFAAFGAILAGTLTAVLVPVDAVALGRVNRRHEAQAIAAWRAHQLSAVVRQALRPKDFVPAAP